MAFKKGNYIKLHQFLEMSVRIQFKQNFLGHLNSKIY